MLDLSTIDMNDIEKFFNRNIRGKFILERYSESIVVERKNQKIILEILEDGISYYDDNSALASRTKGYIKRKYKTSLDIYFE